MAAAVANRPDVAALLLEAAEAEGAGAWLVEQRNRYAQTCLHIGARKGSVELLRLLLASASHEALWMRDLEGACPHDIAAKHNNGCWGEALAEAGWAGQPAGGGPQHRRPHGGHAGGAAPCS